MKKSFFILFVCLLALSASAQNKVIPFAVDTVTEDIQKEDAVIDEVLQSGTATKKEKVKYVSQVTKYGFKNLFSNYSYNTTLPYTAQINPNAEFFIQDYMRVHGRYLQGMKSWGMPYFNFIDGVLQQYGLPKELKYIAVIESNLSSNVTSSAGACGPWQFMPGTARNFGLVVNEVVDERTDYYKSTHAAAQYLLQLYKQMHDWLLVMAAYNGGPGRVYGAIKKSGSRNFWDLQFYLPEESRTYVKRFIATHYIMEGTGGITTMTAEDGSVFFTEETTRTSYGPSSGKNPYNQQLSITDSAALADMEVLSISGKYKAAIIAKKLDMPIADFNRYNPVFDKMMASSGNYDLRLPSDKMELFVANKYDILNECVQSLLGSTTIPSTKTTYKANKPVKKKG